MGLIKGFNKINYIDKVYLFNIVNLYSIDLKLI